MRHGMQKWAEVVEVQIVSRVDAETDLLSGSRGRGVLSQRSVASCRWEITSVRFGVKFDAMCSGREDERHRCGGRVHEDRDADAGGSKWRDDSLEQVGLSDHVPAVIGGPLIGSVGNQRALLRPDGVDEAQKFVRRIAFDVELDTKFAGQQP